MKGARGQRPCAVYRLFAYTGQLAYVGRAVDPYRRWKQLRGEYEWPRQVVTERTVGWHKTVAAAVRSERAAIQSEAPLFNVHMVRRGWDAPLLRWLTPVGEPVVPCLYTGRWLIGHAEIERVQPLSTDDAFWIAVAGLLAGTIDQDEAERLCARHAAQAPSSASSSGSLKSDWTVGLSPGD